MINQSISPPPEVDESFYTLIELALSETREILHKKPYGSTITKLDFIPLADALHHIYTVVALGVFLQ